MEFVSGIYTSRKLEQALRENVAFVWISSQRKPDFRTLNNFWLRLGNNKIIEVIRDFNEQIKDMDKGKAKEAKSKLKRTEELTEKREARVNLDSGLGKKLRRQRGESSGVYIWR